ncbi:MAG: ATP synthase archaeal subunit H [Bacillota bacterium]|nr:ATP synthase archaeal subunit H [Bacillota bacterium]
MALDAIKEIKEAEEKAQSIIKEAENKGKELLKNAEIQGKKIEEDLMKEAKEECNTILAAAEQEGNEKAKPIIDDGDKEILNLKNISPELKEKAVNLIVERIVMRSGNC